MFSKEVYIKRRNALRGKIKNGIAVFLGNNESAMNYASNTYHFRQDSSFLYFFGLDFPGIAGMVDFDENCDYLFGNDVDIEDIIWMGPQVSFKENALKVGIEKAFRFEELYKKVAKAIQQGRKVHFLPPYRGENKMSLSDLLGIMPCKIKTYVSEELIKAVVDLRSVKDEEEIKDLEIAAASGYAMHTTAMKMAQPGIIEQEIAGRIEGIAISKGTGVSFPVILSQNGETLHNHKHNNILQKGKLMLTDAGAESANHYASDFTRTVPVGGVFTQKQKEIYQIVLNALNGAIELIKPGIPYRNIHLEAAKIITTGLKELGLMKGNIDDAVKNGAHAMFFPHGLGHMMGLDVHDMEDLGEDYVGYDKEIVRSDQFGTAYLRLGRKLEKGFVITTEPGIYFIPALIDKWKNEGINHDFINFDKINKEYRDFGGIRLEDDILLTETSWRHVGKRIPVSIAEVEELMRSKA